MKNTCSQTSLHDFARCYFHNDYGVLLENDAATEDQLKAAWQGIYEQYCLLTGSLEYIKILKCLNEIIRLQKIIIHAGAAICVLCYEFSQDSINALKKIGFNYEFSKTDPESLQKDVEKCAKKIKDFEFQLNIQEKKLLELYGIDEKGNEKGANKQQSESDFLKSVAIVGKSNGYHISMKSTMLDEWAGMVKLHNEMNTK